MFGSFNRLLPALIFVGLSGCSKIPDWDNRYGPGPNISRESVIARIEKQEELMTALRMAAEKSELPATKDVTTGDVKKPPARQATTTTPVWYRAALLGFNYADEECNEYLRLNFRLTRMRDRDGKVFEQLHDATPGLLKAAMVSDPTITTIGAALGLGRSLTDAYMSSYLFTSMEPNVVFRTVTKLQNAYRAEAEMRKASYDSSAVAYRSMQNYYSLCFPQTIEAKMSEFIAEATTDTEKKGGATPPVVTDDPASNLATSPATIDPKLTSPKRQ